MTDLAALTARLEREGAFVREVVAAMDEVLVGQRDLVNALLIGLLADGHVLLEGVPGLAKSLSVQALSTALGGSFKRIQFTPDLLPSDLVGTQVFSPKTGEWSVREGPVFANFVLADEINRAPAKVQSALLEAMQEREVTISGETHRLPEPFLVLATQNPVEQEGTYPLPEAQVDRFMLKVIVDYPEREEERLVVRRMATNSHKPVTRVVSSPDEILRVRALVDEIHVDEKIVTYVLDLVSATRKPEDFGLPELKSLILYGASPRASIALVKAARATAFLGSRAFVLPQDIRSVAMNVLRHRVITTYEAEAEGLKSENVLDRILDHVPIP